MKSDKPENEKEYWFSGLDSFGMQPKKTNDLNDSKEMSDLVENVRQTMFQEYKTAYAESRSFKIFQFFVPGLFIIVAFAKRLFGHFLHARLPRASSTAYVGVQLLKLRKDLMQEPELLFLSASCIFLFSGWQ
jgi:hypothetical protein